MKIKIIYIAAIVIATTITLINLKEKPELKIKGKEENGATIYRANKFTSPLYGFMTIDRIQNDTIYFDINLEMAKKELKTDSIFLITSSNGKPQKIAENNFKVRYGENFNFITGYGFENMMFMNSNFPRGAVITVNFKDGQPVL
ncbi:hypothetical protein COT98_02970 [Candidatus Falkowbacteria bacterium CG10_big_fil_rev_8_21_14_0_10_39_9]|uniref:Uncharacterized protein n=1 Tax=Candidatus Falkowbacteria bacterium CG10_big_fil_rev_8_21_14_0_10_39_9 TaxID=1974566 RepID=A0A2M6WP64_9BACT|nr:MAG: hypothetical protein COT98_02970 [Candidatus Falkowbacteria bacterium CG10_big_fil_rev_8_21_14_0_10_39_9]